MQLTVVIPCYNEGERIYNTLEQIEDYLREQHYDYKIIVVDDCSKDNTFQRAFKYLSSHHKVKLYRNEHNKGKGYSIRMGLSLNKSDYYLFTDCDLSVSMQELNVLFQYVKDNDMIIASRYSKDSHIIIEQSLLRRFYSRCFNFIVNSLLSLNVKDTQVGFKLYNKRVRNCVINFGVINGFSFDVETLVIAKINNLKYKEVGIIWQDNKPRNFPIKNIIEMFLEIILIAEMKVKSNYSVKGELK